MKEPSARLAAAWGCRLVRLDEVNPQPWRNGGGMTRELLAWPEAERWRARVSVADIAEDGPFSPFPGVDRTLVDLVHAADALAVSLGLGSDAGEMARTVDPGVWQRLGLQVRRMERVAGESLEAVEGLARALEAGRENAS